MIGRWTSVDPNVEDGQETATPYGYAWDDPIKFTDPDGRKPSPGWNRFWGGLRAVGGALQVTAGVSGGIATSWTGVGAVAGGVAAVHGADDFQAGVRQLWTGEETESLTFQGIKATAKFAGASDNAANNIATFSDIGLSFVGGGAGAFKVLNNGSKVAEFTVAQGKLDYAFGKVVEGSAHNVERSAQNLKDLTTLGIKSEKQLIKVFGQAFAKGTEVSSKTNEFGTTVSKVINIGKKGSITTSFFYEGGDLSKVPKVTTLIPKIFK